MTETKEHSITPADRIYTPWEYVVRTFQGQPSDATLTHLLDVEGRQEWELVSFDFQTGRSVFKRPGAGS